ncbi:MAG: hypothetical protein ACE5FM_10570 [Methyloligellaceae bacterium]
MSIERAKLLLEYCKAIAWPAIVLVVLVTFFGPVSRFIDRLEVAKFPGGVQFAATGSDKAEAGQLSKKSPEISFNIQATTISRSDCVGRGTEVLKAADYKRLGVNDASVAYGYDIEYVAAVWCHQTPGQVIIVVSGPSVSAAHKRRNRLMSDFNSASQ